MHQQQQPSAFGIATGSKPVVQVTPINFPMPSVKRCALRKIALQLKDRIEPKSGLETANGNMYEIGRVLKDAIYGQVYHAVAVHRIPQSGTTSAPGGIAGANGGAGGQNQGQGQGQGQNVIYARGNPVQQVAIKVYSKARIVEYRGNTQEDPVKELSSMQYLGEHPHIMQQIECVEDRDNIYSIMPFCDGGELYDMIEANGAMTEDQARFFFVQVVHAVMYLQSKGVGHRDLSLENIMFDSSHKCYVIDFGMCLRIPVLPQDHASLRQALEVIVGPQVQAHLSSNGQGAAGAASSGACAGGATGMNRSGSDDSAGLSNGSVTPPPPPPPDVEDDSAMCEEMTDNDQNSNQSNQLLNGSSSSSGGSSSSSMGGPTSGNDDCESAKHHASAVMSVLSSLTSTQVLDMVTIHIPRQGVCGKRNYIAPEVLDGSASFDAFAADIWALGVILFIMLAGVPPVDAAHGNDERFRLIKGGYLGAMVEQWGINLTPLAIDLLNRVLKATPSERPSLQQIISHPWVRNERQSGGGSRNIGEGTRGNGNA